MSEEIISRDMTHRAKRLESYLGPIGYYATTQKLPKKSMRSARDIQSWNILTAKARYMTITEGCDGKLVASSFGGKCTLPTTMKLLRLSRQISHSPLDDGAR